MKTQFSTPRSEAFKEAAKLLKRKNFGYASAAFVTAKAVHRLETVFSEYGDDEIPEHLESAEGIISRVVCDGWFYEPCHHTSPQKRLRRKLRSLLDAVSSHSEISMLAEMAVSHWHRHYYSASAASIA